jgi:ribosomal-protein-alanine acetyltransferase
MKKQISVIPIEESFITQIQQISKDCKISLWTEKDFIDELQRRDSYKICCATSNPKNIVGFIFASLITSETMIHQKQDKHNLKFDEAEILSFAVSPQYQGKGIGQVLLDNFVEFCINTEIRVIWLEVRKSNNQAQGFYSKNGFQISHIRKNYYQNPVEDALVMKVNLHSA